MLAVPSLQAVDDDFSSQDVRGNCPGQDADVSGSRLAFGRLALLSSPRCCPRRRGERVGCNDAAEEVDVGAEQLLAEPLSVDSES